MQTQNQTTDFTPSPTPATTLQNSERQMQANSSETSTEGIFPSTLSEKRRKRPRFNADNLTPQPMCVAWIDIMGTKNAMLHSLRTAANFVAKLHADIDCICNQLRPILENNDSLEVFRMMDGAYIVSTNPGIVFALMRNVMRWCALRFLQESDPRQKSMIRAAVAWGNVITGEELNNCLDIKENPNSKKILTNVMVGMPFTWCNADEHLAPPFGIFVDASIREQTQGEHGIIVPDTNVVLPKQLTHSMGFSTATKGPQHIGWVLDRWWGKKAQQNPKSLPANLYQALRRHLSWLRAHPVESGLPEERTQNYQKLVEEYFSAFHVPSKTKSHSSHRQLERLEKKDLHPTRFRHQKHEKSFGKHIGRNDRQFRQHRNGRVAFQNPKAP